jgi:hypothetical protein
MKLLPPLLWELLEDSSLLLDSTGRMRSGRTWNCVGGQHHKDNDKVFIYWDGVGVGLILTYIQTSLLSSLERYSNLLVPQLSDLQNEAKPLLPSISLLLFPKYKKWLMALHQICYWFLIIVGLTPVVTFVFLLSRDFHKMASRKCSYKSCSSDIYIMSLESSLSGTLY